ncbi:MAG TPA: NAD(P)H-hydrate epimerase [Phycisphaerales bacterium]|jgi:NAD(P)H-hydrate epimerase|nr:NAD(P)H-hydrate epimerase [Phycisphaerales bacterium]
MNRHEDSGAEVSSAHHPGEGCCGGHKHAADSAQGGCCGGSGGGGCCGGGAAAATGADQIYVFSRRQIRELDRLAVQEFGIPSILLMENAARGIASVILEGLSGVADPSVLIVCGPGNNGGDGLALARHLANRGVKTAVILGVPQSRLTGDPLINLAVARNMGIPIIDGSSDPAAAIAEASRRIGEPVVIADALLGTGLERPAAGAIADLIHEMNALKAKGSTLVAIDVPSGLDCDTGLPATDGTTPGPAVEADLTIALAGVKAGFLAMPAQKYVGDLVVVDIGAPRSLIERLGHPLTAAHKG